MKQALSFIRRAAIALAVLPLCAGDATASQTLTSNSETVLFTDASGPKCKEDISDEAHFLSCSGPAGYAVQIMFYGNSAALTIAPTSLVTNANPVADIQFGGFGDKIQWVIRNRAPKAAVIRAAWSIYNDKGTVASETEKLLVFAIQGTKSCVYSAIDVHTAYANDAALALARKAASSPYATQYCKPLKIGSE